MKTKSRASARSSWIKESGRRRVLTDGTRKEVGVSRMNDSKVDTAGGLSVYGK